MIPVREVRALAQEWGLREDVVEKDYVLGWLISAIGADAELSGSWVFKGGTCIRKCYYETYRFSEDLDFTVIGGGAEEPAHLIPIFERIGQWLFDRCGLEVVVDAASFKRRQNLRGNLTTLGSIGFRGPRQPPGLPKVKLDITSDEVLVHPAVRRPVNHPYSDRLEPLAKVGCYSIVDLLSEKLRALAERCRPRDLYDVVHINRHPDLLGRSAPVLAALMQKCAHAGIGVPDADAIRASPYRAEIEQEWSNMLAHQLPHLPPFAEFWGTLDDLFAWLNGRQPLHVLPRIEPKEKLDATWAAPRAMTSWVSWRSGAPLELVRFAGANRLKVDVDYRAESGRQGRRIVEPYSLRRTQDGNLLLYVVNDYGVLRGYRVDRIAAARIVDEPFQPRFIVEF